MAHKKGAGSTRNGRDSHSKRLGVKLFGGQTAINGNIIIRQRGTKFYPGEGVDIGKDHTIYAVIDGVVTFKKARKNRTFVHVLPKNNGTEVIEEAPKAVKKEVVEEKTDAPKAEAVVEETKVEETKETTTKAKEEKKESKEAKEPKAKKADDSAKKEDKEDKKSKADDSEDKPE
ncbi:MAG: 50S ribosomal protein L27 [Chitinophagaceae bacterium]|nr:MAG: 50S ribosomal protein L27 [Chitinophagaceae bacterium]